MKKLMMMALLAVAGGVCFGENDDAKYNSTAMNAGVYTAGYGENGGVKVLFIGNSITLHEPLAKIGWTNNWGMAASAAEKDYVHLVTKGIEKKTGRKAEVKVYNCAAFERDFKTDDLKWADALAAFDPDVFILAIGENMPNLDGEEDVKECRAAVKRLLGKFFEGKRKRPHSVIRGNFWPSAVKDEAIAHAGSDYAIPFVKCDCYNEKGMDASDTDFWHKGVQAHPGDKGMAEIARRLLEGLYPTESGWEAEADGKRVTVKPIRVSAMPFNVWAPGYQRPMEQTEIAGMVRIEANGPTSWKVKAPGRKFRRATVRPLSRQVKAETAADGTISFTLPSPGYYTLELDDFHRPLEIFVDPKRDFAEEKKAATIVFGPGRYEPVVVKLKSHDRVYLDKDAEVFGSFQIDNAEDVVISGYGTISGMRNRREGNHCYRYGMDGAIRIIDSKKVKIDGPTVIDSCCWMVSAFNSSDLEFAHLKVTGAWRYNTDGIDICNSQRVKIRDCFVHSFDDTIVIKGNFPALDRKDPVEDISVERCVCWCGWGRTLEIGLETWAPKFRNIRFEDCDLIRNNMAAMSVHLGGPAKVENVAFKNIRVEFPAGEIGNQYQSSRDLKYSKGDVTNLAALYSITNDKMFGNETMYDNIKKEYGCDPSTEPCGNCTDVVIDDITVYLDPGVAEPPRIVQPTSGTAFGRITICEIQTLSGEVPRELFGQNLEHTRASITGGISAETLRNRKFAGKSDSRGVASEWNSCGNRAAYDLVQDDTFTRHASGSAWIPRRNEVSAQKIMSFTDGFAGISQDGIELVAGKRYVFKARVKRVVGGNAAKWRARVVGPSGCERGCGIIEAASPEWTVLEFGFECPADETACVEIGVIGRASGIVGVVSLMPMDNFHGMRRDVIEKIKEIGTSIIRWPGGNFAGDYRWRDCLLDRDERSPVQSYLEHETQPYTGGYDVNDVGTDEVLALCEEVGALPFFTINAAWDSPEGSAEWVKYCRGKVKHWSLGNEFGYEHMEGPKTPEAYAAVARAHAEAMLKVDPELKLVSSGHYPGLQNDAWLEGSGIPLADIAPAISAHRYSMQSGVVYDFSTPEVAEKTFADTIASADRTFDEMYEMVKLLPEKLRVSFDEWNFWYSWFREDGPVKGVFTMHYLHRLMREHEALKLENACFFQAINEGAIEVTPRTARLTAQGEAMRLAKGHIGGEVVTVGRLREVLVTKKDGAFYLTAFNPSPTKTLELKLDRLPHGQYRGERLVPDDGYLPGSRYTRKPHEFTVNHGSDAVITLSPMEILALSGGVAAADWNDVRASQKKCKSLSVGCRKSCIN